MFQMGYGSIQQYTKRIKHFYGRLWAIVRTHLVSQSGKELVQVLTLVFVGLTSFFLGMRASNSQHTANINYDTSHRIEYVIPATAQELSAPHGKVVASRNGKRYHYPWCKGASTISEKNRRWFQSEAEAENAGYTLAGNCK